MKELMDTARALEGLARHASTHAAGVVISQKPLMEHVPLYKTSNNEIVTQYSMTDVEKIGLVKFDFLGLKTLTMIHRAVALIQADGSHDHEMNVNQLPLNDAATFALLSTGKTTGIFQLESSGMRSLLMKIKPETFEDLIAILALFRPGPLESGMVDDFIKRKRDPSQVVYNPPQLEPILKETYGVIVYQEQVMAIANQLAGFSLGQADLLRRAMGKKKPEEMAQQKELFIAGAKKNHFPEKKSSKLFDQIAYFAGYGFNKSHSAAYALVTYQTAYLKTHHPMEFMAALLSSEMGNTDKMVGYFTECRELGLKILPPDVNQSGKDFSVTNEGIRFGLAAIKNVGEAAVESILDTRNQGGPFASFFDCCCRLDFHKVNKRVLEGLIKVGAFDSSGAARSQLLAVMDTAIEEANRVQRMKREGQTSLFDVMAETSPTGSVDPRGFPLPNIPEWPQDQLLKYERELTGFYITAHPLTRHATAIRRFATSSTATLSDCGEGKEVKLCGVVSSIKPLTTKKGDRMAYVRLEDLQGTVEVILFPELFKSCSELIEPEAVIQLTGTVDQMENGARVKATAVQSLVDLQARDVKQVVLMVEEPMVEPSALSQLEKIFQRYPGPTSVTFTFHLASHLQVQTSGPPYQKILPSTEFLEEVEQVLGKGSAILQ
jgi:DNA polymerase-3 subunit alpha